MDWGLAGFERRFQHETRDEVDPSTVAVEASPSVSEVPPIGRLLEPALLALARQGGTCTNEEMHAAVAAVVIICDRDRGVAKRVQDAWPPDVEPPRIFHDRERADAAPYAKMHAKCLLVDGRDLLVTSANFTFHGLHGNIEIGVRLGGAPTGEARKVFSHLVESGVLQEIDDWERR